MEETKKVAKRPTGFKANVKRSWKKFVNAVKKKYAKFMELPKHIRYITYIWVIVFVVLLIIILGTVINNGAKKKYQNMEDSIARAAINYLKEDAIFGENSKTKVDMNVLIDKSLLSEDDVVNKSCRGFAIVEYSDEFEITGSKGYVTCKKYTTEGYKEYAEIDKKNIK